MNEAVLPENCQDILSATYLLMLIRIRAGTTPVQQLHRQEARPGPGEKGRAQLATPVWSGPPEGRPF
jgi:hypothetical protein